MGPFEKVAVSSGDKLTTEYVCLNRWLNLKTAEHPGVYTPDEVADSARAAEHYTAILIERKEAARWDAGTHNCRLCRDVRP
jgi:hypothetical protein